MELKGRLKLIANKVPACGTACDIGTDHAYIPIYLVVNKICKKAVASDVGEGPVASAKENIGKYKLEEMIETRLGNGLSTISEGESDVIIIAGMGGELISSILSDGLSKARRAAALILQPMNSPEILRKWLYENGFEIYDEEMVNEGEKIYDVISACWRDHKNEVDEINYYIGEMLIKKKDPLLRIYINKRLSQLEKAIKEISKSGINNSEAFCKHTRMSYELKKILKELNL